MKFKSLSLLTISLAYAFSANAAPDAGELMRQQQDLDRLKNLPQAIPAPKKEEQVRKKTESSAKILVRNFRFEGNLGKFTAEQLANEVKELIGKELSFEEIQLAADKITAFYQEKGYFLAKAIIPKQEVKDGIVVIQVNEGKLDPKKPYEVKGQDLRIDPERVKRYLDSAMDGSLYQPSLERGLLNIADNPSLTATANIEPGDTVGTSRIIVETIEGPRVDGSVTADTYGSRYTGQFRLTGNVNINNPSSYGDQFSATAITAPGNDFYLGQLAYKAPIGTDGLRAGVSYTALNFQLNNKIDTGSDTVKGQANNWNFNLRYPLYRTAMRAAYLGATYDWKNSFNSSGTSVTSDKRTDLYGLNLTLENTDDWGGAGFSQLVAGVSSGKLDLSRLPNYDAARDDAGQTSGNFNKTNLQFLRIQRASERISLQFLGSAQWANKNLDGSEKLSLGGPAGVRAYPVGEAVGDEGYKYSIDAKYVLATGTKVGDLVGSIFYDHGMIHQYKRAELVSLNGAPNSYSLSGWGFGLDAIAAGKFQVKLGWAKAIGTNPALNNGNNSDGKSNRSRYWLLGMVTF